MERSRGPLGALGDMLAGGSQALLGQAQSLAGDVQRRIADVVPPVLSGELDRLNARVRRLELLLANGAREIVGPVRRVASIQPRAVARAGADPRAEDVQWPWK